MRYFTKEETLAAVTNDGYALYDAARNLQDDYEVVLTAIAHGGTIRSASFRLQNNPNLVVEDAKNNFTFEKPYLCDYPEVLFCAKHSRDMLALYAEKYYDWDEFVIEMKLFYGDDFVAPISKYNKMSKDELNLALNQCRRQLVRDCRALYKKAYSIYDLENNRKLSKSIRHQFLRNQLTGYDEFRRPFVFLADVLQNEIVRIQELKQQNACGAGGSYPERMVNSVLRYLKIEYSREQIFAWSKDTTKGTKRYDFYVPILNAIIEVHGAQHYDGGFETLGGRSLQEERENDRFKESLARKNGIENYIVINAVSSTFRFIKESILQNVMFTQLFDIESINWDAVKTSIEENETLVETPVLDEHIAYYNTLLKLFNEEFKKDDFEIPKDTSENLSLQMMEQADGCSGSTLLPHEVVLLSKVSSYDVKNIPSWVPNYWYRHYGIKDIREHINKFIFLGLIEPCEICDMLAKVNVPVLKKCLSDQGLDSSGKKDELIERIKANIPMSELSGLAFPQYYVLTTLGKHEIRDNGYLIAAQTWGLTVWEASALYKKHKDTIEQKFKRMRKLAYSSSMPNPKAVDLYNDEIGRYLRGMRDSEEK